MCGNHQHDATTGATDTTSTPTEASAAPAEAGASSCCGHSAAPAAPVAPAEDDMATCPVMAGTPVSKASAEAAGLFRDYEGNRYWFCCAACGPLWDAEPAKYAAA